MCLLVFLNLERDTVNRKEKLEGEIDKTKEELSAVKKALEPLLKLKRALERRLRRLLSTYFRIRQKEKPT